MAYKEPEAITVLEQKIHQERVYLQNQIIQIEMKQIAESITRVTHARKMTHKHLSHQEMVLEKYGPPIVRKTRHMASQSHSIAGKKSAIDRRQGSQMSPEFLRSQSQGPEKRSLENQTISKDNIGALNRPLLLIRQL